MSSTEQSPSAATTHYRADVQMLIRGLNIQNVNKLLY